MCSLASANGPSVIAGTPSRTLTVLVFEGSASASPPTSSPDSVSSWMIASTSPISSAPCSPKNTSRVPGLSQISSMYFTSHSSWCRRPVMGASHPYVGASGEVSTSAPAGADQLDAGASASRSSVIIEASQSPRSATVMWVVPGRIASCRSRRLRGRWDPGAALGRRARRRAEGTAAFGRAQAGHVGHEQHQGDAHDDQARHIGSPGIAVGEERLGREGRLLEAGTLGRLLAAHHHRGQLGALLVGIEHLGIDIGDVQLLARLLDVPVEVDDQLLLDRLLGRLQVGPQRLLVGGQLGARSEEHTSELQSRGHLVCRLLLEKKKQKTYQTYSIINIQEI